MTIRISIAARVLAIGMVAALVLAGTAMGEVSRDVQVCFSRREGLSLRTGQINTGRS